MKTKIKFRKLVFLVILLVIPLFILFSNNDSYTQDYPKRIIQLVVPYGPGGLTDIFWRTVSDHLGTNIKGTITILNKPGGGGVVGTSFVVNSKPDGYTLVNISPETVSIAPAFMPNLPYDPEKDLTYVAKASIVSMGIAVRSESPFKSIEELISYAKNNPKKLKAGGMGIVGTPHMIHGVFSREANIEVIYVPFDGGGEVVTNLLGGHVDYAYTSIPSIKGQVLSGRARFLAICSPKRVPGFLDTPTLEEKGYKKSSFATTLGLGGPKGLASSIVNQWEEALEKTLKDPAVIANVEKIGGIVIDFKSGEEYRKEMMEKLVMFKELVPTLPIKK